MLTPFSGLVLYFFFCGIFPSFFLATLLVIIPGLSDSLACIGESIWLGTGCGPKRRETCLLSSLRVLIGEFSCGSDWRTPGGREPEGQLVSSRGGSMISSR